LVLDNNIKLTKKLIEENKFNFEIKNNKNQTSLDLINSQEMSVLMIREFVKKILILTEKYNQKKSNITTLLVNFN